MDSPEVQSACPAIPVLCLALLSLLPILLLPVVQAQWGAEKWVNCRSAPQV